MARMTSCSASPAKSGPALITRHRFNDGSPHAALTVPTNDSDPIRDHAVSSRIATLAEPPAARLIVRPLLPVAAPGVPRARSLSSFAAKLADKCYGNVAER